MQYFRAMKHLECSRSCRHAIPDTYNSCLKWMEHIHLKSLVMKITEPEKTRVMCFYRARFQLISVNMISLETKHVFRKQGSNWYSLSSLEVSEMVFSVHLLVQRIHLQLVNSSFPQDVKQTFVFQYHIYSSM